MKEYLTLCVDTERLSFGPQIHALQKSQIIVPEMWCPSTLSLRCFSFLKPYPSSYRNSNYRKTTTATIPIAGCCLNSLMETAKTTTDEFNVGIFSYVSQLPGFHAILKQRYSDFIVNEVDKDGIVVHLTSLEVPPQVIIIVNSKFFTLFR